MFNCIARYIATGHGLFSSYEGEVISALPTCLPLFSVVVMHMTLHATYSFFWWPSCCASMHRTLLAIGSFQSNRFIHLYMQWGIYICQDKGQHAFNIQADYSIYTVVNNRLSDIAILMVVHILSIDCCWWTFTTWVGLSLLCSIICSLYFLAFPQFSAYYAHFYAF